MGFAAHVLDAAGLPGPSADFAVPRGQCAELLLSVWVREPAFLGDWVAVRLGGTAAGRACGVWHEEPGGERGG